MCHHVDCWVLSMMSQSFVNFRKFFCEYLTGDIKLPLEYRLNKEYPVIPEGNVNYKSIFEISAEVYYLVLVVLELLNTELPTFTVYPEKYDFWVC